MDKFSLKALPKGISDFSALIKNCYYIDKTKLIEDLLVEATGVALFTRPRRFGKTLNMSMLKYFFDVENAEENRKLFKNLYIEKSPLFSGQGKYPVIFISLKDFNPNTAEEMNEDITDFISELFKKYKFLLEKIDKYDFGKFELILTKKLKINELRKSLKFLSELLYKYYNKKVIILIDEYDSPLISAYEHNYYDEAINFFRTFFSSALKDNEYLQMGVMTGILRVAKEGIFSGLNNLIVYSILNDKYSSYFGLEEKEVEEMLKYYGMDYKLAEVKDWYDGYKFGNSEVYNPWSIINYVANKELKPYWTNTSSNVLIKSMLNEASHNGSEVFDDLEKLFNGEFLNKLILEGSDFTSLSDVERIWQLLLFSGYLTVAEKITYAEYKLKIANREVYSFFKELFINNFLGYSNTLRVYNLVRFLDKEDAESLKKFEQSIQEVFLNSVSFYDIEKETEKYYHIFMLGLLASLEDKYYLSSNRESGLGRYDILLEPRNKNKAGYVLEFKTANSDEEMEKKVNEAVKQIQDNKYYSELKRRNVSKVIGLGIVFYGKKVKMLSKEI